MMAVDASAILAILFGEPEAETFEIALAESAGAAISAVNYWEVLVRAEAVRGASGLDEVAVLLAGANVDVAPVDAAAARAAAAAFRRFGRRAAAKLNLGDCFAYALATREGDGLLYKGEDFAKTDVPSAPAV